TSFTPPHGTLPKAPRALFKVQPAVTPTLYPPRVHPSARAHGPRTPRHSPPWLRSDRRAARGGMLVRGNRIAMDLTKNFVKAKRPCMDGFRWFLRHCEDGGNYQDVLDALVADGRADDACWLLDQFGPTDAVRTLDTLFA